MLPHLSILCTVINIPYSPEVRGTVILHLSEGTEAQRNAVIYAPSCSNSKKTQAPDQISQVLTV